MLFVWRFYNAINGFTEEENLTSRSYQHPYKPVLIAIPRNFQTNSQNFISNQTTKIIASIDFTDSS